MTVIIRWKVAHSETAPPVYIVEIYYYNNIGTNENILGNPFVFPEIVDGSVRSSAQVFCCFPLGDPVCFEDLPADLGLNTMKQIAFFYILNACT